MKKYVFGPVPSRRLGFSLGVDILPSKECTFDCVYCQIGKTSHCSTERKSFFDPLQIVGEVLDVCKQAKRTDIITFSGSGEPTLSSDIGWLIREVKKKTNLPVALITNGSLFFDEDVRRDSMGADIVLPSLDAVTEETFQSVNRPHPSLCLASITSGLMSFRKEYRGKIWLEIMFLKGLNDSPKEIHGFKEFIAQIDPEKVQINTVTRPPLMKTARRLDEEDLERAASLLGERAEIICTFNKAPLDRVTSDWQASALSILERRSLTLKDIERISGASGVTVQQWLRELVRCGGVEKRRVGRSVFYVITEEKKT